MAIKVNNNILKTVRYATGYKCRALSNGVIWQIAQCKGIWIPESSKFLLVEFGIRKKLAVKSGILGFGIRNRAQGIRNPTNEWNPESTFHWQRVLNQMPRIRNPWREIQNPRMSWIPLHGARHNLLSWNTRRAAELRFLAIEYFFAKVFTCTYPDDLDPRELVLEAYSELSPTLLVSE